MALDLNFQAYHTDFLHVKCLKMFMAEQKTCKYFLSQQTSEIILSNPLLVSIVKLHPVDLAWYRPAGLVVDTRHSLEEVTTGDWIIFSKEGPLYWRQPEVEKLSSYSTRLIAESEEVTSLEKTFLIKINFFSDYVIIENV